MTRILTLVLACLLACGVPASAAEHADSNGPVPVMKAVDPGHILYPVPEVPGAPSPWVIRSLHDDPLASFMTWMLIFSVGAFLVGTTYRARGDADQSDN